MRKTKLLYNVDFSSVLSTDPININTISLSYLDNNKFIISGLDTINQIFLNTEYFMNVLQKSIDTVNNDGDVKELKNFIYDNMNNMECIDFPSPKSINNLKPFTVSRARVVYNYSHKERFDDGINIKIELFDIDSHGNDKFVLRINIYNDSNMNISIIPGYSYYGENIVIELDAVKMLQMLRNSISIVSLNEYVNNIMKNFEDSTQSLLIKPSVDLHVTYKKS